jgi:site-specific DNA-methyltransferase (adenine-specific)
MIDRVLSGAARWAVVQGDNLVVMRGIPSESVQLAYLDPPFFTQRDFELEDGRLAFSDRWESFEGYLEHVLTRCAAARDLLTDDGTLILHVDPKTSHYHKVALDRLFGRDCFRNEIVWRYRRWPVEGKDFQRMHDVLLRYTKSPDKQRWNQLYEPLAESTVEVHGTRKQRHHRVDGPGLPARRLGYSDEDSLGAPMSDVWEIGLMAPGSTKRTGWSTEKPPELLERIIASQSHPGDVFLEPYCGSGVGVERAVSLGRRGIGIDQSPIAVSIARARVDGPLFQGVSP